MIPAYLYKSHFCCNHDNFLCIHQGLRIEKHLNEETTTTKQQQRETRNKSENKPTFRNQLALTSHSKWDYCHQISTTPDFNSTKQVLICKVTELLFRSQPLMIKVMWSCRRENVFTFWTCVIMTALAIYVIPRKFMCNSQGVNAIFVQSEIVGLMWSPVSEVAWLVISPNKCTLRIPVIESDPSSISIQTLLYINIYFLTFYGDEAGVVFLAGFLRLSPVFARLTCGVAKARKVWPAWFTHV